MSQYKLYSGGPFTQNNGSTITATSTDINLGTAKNIRDSEVLNRSDWKSGVMLTPDVLGGRDVTAADFETVVSGDCTFSESSEGLTQLILAASHGLVQDDFIVATTNITGSYRVVRVVDGTTIVINLVWNSAYEAYSDLSYKVVKGTFGRQGVDNFIMRKNDATVHGEAGPNSVTAGASDNGRRRKVAKHSDTIRTRKVATAIREGKYNISTGEFTSGYPTSSNDSMNADDATAESTNKIGVKGEYTYKAGGSPITGDYEAKNN